MTAIQMTGLQIMNFSHQIDEETFEHPSNDPQPLQFNKTWEFMRDMVNVDDEELIKRKRQWRYFPCKSFQMEISPCVQA
jgi:hypothetical protein